MLAKLVPHHARPPAIAESRPGCRSPLLARYDQLMTACRESAELEGILAAPEGGAGLAAIRALVGGGTIAADKTVVLFNTGSGHTYLEAWGAALGV
jgi:threonine synthase